MVVNLSKSLQDVIIFQDYIITIMNDAVKAEHYKELDT